MVSTLPVSVRLRATPKLEIGIISGVPLLIRHRAVSESVTPKVSAKFNHVGPYILSFRSKLQARFLHHLGPVVVNRCRELPKDEELCQQPPLAVQLGPDRSPCRFDHLQPSPTAPLPHERDEEPRRGHPSRRLHRLHR